MITENDKGTHDIKQTTNYRDTSRPRHRFSKQHTCRRISKLKSPPRCNDSRNTERHKPMTLYKGYCLECGIYIRSPYKTYIEVIIQIHDKVESHKIQIVGSDINQ